MIERWPGRALDGGGCSDGPVEDGSRRTRPFLVMGFARSPFSSSASGRRAASPGAVPSPGLCPLPSDPISSGPPDSRLISPSSSLSLLLPTLFNLPLLLILPSSRLCCTAPLFPAPSPCRPGLTSAPSPPPTALAFRRRTWTTSASSTSVSEILPLPLLAPTRTCRSTTPGTLTGGPSTGTLSMFRPLRRYTHLPIASTSGNPPPSFSGS